MKNICNIKLSFLLLASFIFSGTSSDTDQDKIEINVIEQDFDYVIINYRLIVLKLKI